jgi:peptide/nickel transport system permease protein
MGWYVVKRLAAVVAMLVIISMATFVVYFAGPTDPASYTCGRHCTAEIIEANRHALGFDKPIYVQYGQFLKGLVTERRFPDDPEQQRRAPQTIVHCAAPCLGYSFVRQEPVTRLIADGFPITFSIALGGFVLWMAIGITGGCLAAINKGRPLDRAIVGASLGAYSLPTFFIGLLLLTFVAIRWRLVPIPGYSPFSDNPILWAQGLLLPWITLASVFAAGYVRLTRAFMIETLAEDYIRTARSKGVKKLSIILKHALRAVLTPIATMAGLDLGALLGGMIVVEQVFGFNGLGRLAVQSVVNVDLPTIVALVLVAATAYTTANLIVDVLYGVIDPRVRQNVRSR